MNGNFDGKSFKRTDAKIAADAHRVARRILQGRDSASHFSVGKEFGHAACDMDVRDARPGIIANVHATPRAGIAQRLAPFKNCIPVSLKKMSPSQEPNQFASAPSP